MSKFYVPIFWTFWGISRQRASRWGRVGWGYPTVIIGSLRSLVNIGYMVPENRLYSINLVVRLTFCDNCCIRLTARGSDVSERSNDTLGFGLIDVCHTSLSGWCRPARPFQEPSLTTGRHFPEPSLKKGWWAHKEFLTRPMSPKELLTRPISSKELLTRPISPKEFLIGLLGHQIVPNYAIEVTRIFPNQGDESTNISYPGWRIIKEILHPG